MTQEVQLELHLPLLALRGFSLFPGQRCTLHVGRQKSIAALQEAQRTGSPIAALAQHESEVDEPDVASMFDVGTIARVESLQALENGTWQADLLGEARCRVHLADGPLPGVARVQIFPDSLEKDEEMQVLASCALEAAIAWAGRQVESLRRDLPTSAADVDPSHLADRIAACLPLPPNEQQVLLAATSARKRLELLIQFLRRDQEANELASSAHKHLREAIERNQHLTFLREQLRLIQSELGQLQGNQDESQRLRQLVQEKTLPAAVQQFALAEIDRLERMPPMAGEVANIQTHLDLLLDLPWSTRTEDQHNLQLAQTHLDAEHFGLESVKERILDHLAAFKAHGSPTGTILCLVGPPGVGKTSIARSIAETLGRRFVRIALGGLKDEGEIRGHRKVYLGAQPGRIIQSIHTAGVCNPVILLDEIDKLAADMRGDPASALLEVLDPEQNREFVDHYLGLPFDLSQVFFLATANDLNRIPIPLRERMEIIKLSGYTDGEKLEILRRVILPRQLAIHDLRPEQMEITEDAIRGIVQQYTRETGVREAQQLIAQICRKVVRELMQEAKGTVRVTLDDLSSYLGFPRYLRLNLPEVPEEGVVLALSVSDSGGEVVPVEALWMPGQANVLLSNNVGDLMRDSTQVALSYLRSQSSLLGVTADLLDQRDLHVHIRGAAAKNGASAGAAIIVAMASALIESPARLDLALSGEVTLRGRIAPVGGIREKCLAAQRAGLSGVVLPLQNRPDYERLPESLRRSLPAHFVSTVTEVFSLMLPSASFPPPNSRSGMYISAQ